MSEYELIDEIRMRTAMFTGYSSPTHLHSFLSGFFYANRDEDITEETPSFHGFHDWIADKFGYKESTSGWAYMIEDQRDDKSEALYLFYELLDKYRGIRHKQIAKVEFSHEAKIDRSWRGYSRLKKIKGGFTEIPKPLPKEIIIRQLERSDRWFQMVAKNTKDEILFIWNSQELEKVYNRATEIFGIEKEEWETTKTFSE